ncbi:hypothetical protein [Cryobacterium sp. Y11]|uniref:hypothetical protein n=1 Tax=Cryobacterium sp. Y11 TaxID=2045016 RepID=UPI000CE3D15F|nr:hypothetical protein [Cryobacterium sp. Y11]
MARDRANVRVDIWADQDFRDLTGEAQRLYFQLTSHPTLNYAGVAEWRPGRLAAMACDLTAGSIERAGQLLGERFFIVVDEQTEEVLVRSYVKHDGILKQPKLVVSMTNAYAAIASKLIRNVIAFEVQKMRDRDPNMAAWKVTQTETILRAEAKDIREISPGLTPLFTPELTPELTPAFTPDVTPELTPSSGQAQGLPTLTATTTATGTSFLDDGAKGNETRIPADWVPSKAHFDRAKERNLNITAEAENFRLHAETHDRRAVRWGAAFTMWLNKATPGPAKSNRDAWMQK